MPRPVACGSLACSVGLMKRGHLAAGRLQWLWHGEKVLIGTQETCSSSATTGSMILDEAFVFLGLVFLSEKWGGPWLPICSLQSPITFTDVPRGSVRTYPSPFQLWIMGVGRSQCVHALFRGHRSTPIWEVIDLDLGLSTRVLSLLNTDREYEASKN